MGAMRILVVDDSVHVHQQLKVFLASGGYTDLAFASSAREAFDLLRLDGEAPDPAADLVLMDIDMGKSGHRGDRRLKADARYQDVPIIMVTAETGTESLAMAFAAGAVDYITKPFRKVELLAGCVPSSASGRRRSSGSSGRWSCDAPTTRSRSLPPATGSRASEPAVLRRGHGP